jgi:AbiV family abortive infection protein
MARRRGGRRTNTTRRKVVSGRFLLEGFWYAVEQSGRLLHSATALYEAGHYGAAAGLALLGIEELGKGRILRDFWKEDLAGTPVTLERITRTLEDHPRKLKAGQTIYAFTAAPGSAASDLVQNAMAKVGTPEAREAILKLADLALTLGKRTPHERHAARERAFYVDPNPSGTTWRRPSETPKDVAEEFLLMAMNDYAGQLSELVNPQGEIGEALTAWTDRPSLPPRVWPKDASKPPLH